VLHEPLAPAARPNPFNPATTLHVCLPAPGRVRLTERDDRARLALVE